MTDKFLEEFTFFAKNLAIEAGELIAPLFDSFSPELEIEFKPDETPVTKADNLSENLIVSAIRKQYPSVSILGEESGSSGNADSEYTCLVDPLDGTSSFARGISTYSILISLVRNNIATGHPQVVSCVIYEPQTRRIWYAIKGNGAYVQRAGHANSPPKKILVSSSRDIPVNQAMIIVDAALKFRDIVPDIPSRLNILNIILPEFRRARMIGSLSLQLAYVASGYAEATLADAVGGPYDLCGYLLVEEAGGAATTLSGNRHSGRRRFRRRLRGSQAADRGYALQWLRSARCGHLSASRPARREDACGFMDWRRSIYNATSTNFAIASIGDTEKKNFLTDCCWRALLRRKQATMS